MEKLESQSEAAGDASPVVEIRRCSCPVCGSRDVWKWGKPTFKDRVMMSVFDRSPLTCRRCGHKFHRKVIFGQNN